MARRVLVIAVLTLAGTGTLAPAAGASGPALSVPKHKMQQALRCPDGVASGKPILLVHGTGAKADENWGWNYAKSLPPRGFAVCLIDLPQRSLVDIQVQSEYVVFAIRRMAARSGRQVDVMGHSQGTLQPRWAMKWWPDIREKVDDYIGLAGPDHGTVAADNACALGFCAPAVWQMRRGSNFIRALNAGSETPGPASFTSVYSQTDQFVQPYATARLEGASNVDMQRLCPGRIVEHVQFVWDAAVFAVVMDALKHPGPADTDRIPGSACLGLFAPGLGPSSLPNDPAFYLMAALQTFTSRWPATHEPPLKPYAR